MFKYVICVLLMSCGGSKPAPATAPLPPDQVASKPAGGALTITELEFYNGDELGIKLHADGKLALRVMKQGASAEEWKEAGVLAPDGTMTIEGAEVGRLEADGSFKSKDGRVAPFKFDGDTLVAGDKHITIDDKGALQGGTEGSKLHVKGITDSGSKKAALLVLALVITSSGPPPPEPAKP